MMTTLKLFGMRSAYDEVLATALKRQHQPQRFAGEALLQTLMACRDVGWSKPT
jgi:hypothetical protein